MKTGMRRAFAAAGLEARLFLRSGRIVLPGLFAAAFAGVFYAIQPVDAASSFALGSAAAFVAGAWTGISRAWSEDSALSMVLTVKCGARRLAVAQSLWTALLCAPFGLFLWAYPFISLAFRPGLFDRALSAGEAGLALILHTCAAASGGLFGELFHPRVVRDRKLAYLCGILLSILGATGGMLGLPMAVRSFLPPLYDLLSGVEIGLPLPAARALGYAAWLLLYGAAAYFAGAVVKAKRGY